MLLTPLCIDYRDANARLISSEKASFGVGVIDLLQSLKAWREGR